MKKIVFASALALTLAGAVLTNDVFANDRLVATQSTDGNVLTSEVLKPSSGNVLVGIKGEFLPPHQQSILDAINKIRKEAADEGLVDKYVPVKWSVDHEKTAFVRAAEVSVTLKAERLSSKNNWTAFPSGNSLSGEVLDLNPDGFLKAIENWHAEKANYVAKKKDKTSKEFSFYYENLINPKFTYVGLAAFKNAASPQKAATVALALGTTTSSEELAGGYGSAVQYTEVTASNLSTVKSKAMVVETPLKDFRKSTSDQSGWVQSNGKWYFYESGDVKTGWYKENGTWYYLDEEGIMKTGWFKVGQHWYYANGSGALAVSTTTPDGYRVNANGEWVS